MTSGPALRIGIDFGTTNSSVGLCRDGHVQLVTFPPAASTSSRSLLYLERQRGRPVQSFTGAPAIQRYLAADPTDDAIEGRLVQSLKSYLAARDLHGTEIFGRQYRFVELVARILRDLRQRASEAFGFEVTHALAGRPVHFVGANTPSDNDFAQARLHEAFLLAGFTNVAFALEPVAAAYAAGAATYAASTAPAQTSTQTPPQTLLIGDFGGGTTDFSLLRLHPAAPPEVLGSAGVGLAGDAFDARIVRRLISPALGADSHARSLGKLLPALPAWIYSNLERWHTLSFLRTREVRAMLRAAETNALEPAKIHALRSVIEHDLGYRLHQAVGQVKVALSSHEQADFTLDAEDLHLRTPVTRAAFESWIAPELTRIETALDGLLTQTNTLPAQVDRVFLTGGTSLVPAVHRVFTTRFGAPRVTGGEAFTSVAHGLALMAQTTKH